MESPPPLPVDRLTWAVLLGRWVEFARSAVALPNDEEGRRLRDSVGDVIVLQAVWFALQGLGELEASERALGLDRAAVLIEKHRVALTQRWGGELPAAMGELLADAVEALGAAMAREGYTQAGAGSAPVGELVP